MIKISSAVKERYPDVNFGIMTAHRLHMAIGRSKMDTLKKIETDRIKTKYDKYERKNVLNSEPICHYADYYRKFKKTYPVLLQLESILLNDKGVPNVGVPIETMFLAEINNLLLTAGHDLNQINGNLTINVAVGTESYHGISGKEQQLTKNDLLLSDENGILSSVLNGPDYRTRITEATQNVLYFVYGVDGITGEQIRHHLENIRHYLLTVNPEVEIQTIEIFK